MELPEDMQVKTVSVEVRGNVSLGVISVEMVLKTVRLDHMTQEVGIG